MTEGLVYMYPTQFYGQTRNVEKSNVLKLESSEPTAIEFDRPATVQQKMDTLILLGKMQAETLKKLIEISKYYRI